MKCCSGKLPVNPCRLRHGVGLPSPRQKGGGSCFFVQGFLAIQEPLRPISLVGDGAPGRLFLEGYSWKAIPGRLFREADFHDSVGNPGLKCADVVIGRIHALPCPNIESCPVHRAGDGKCDGRTAVQAATGMWTAAVHRENRLTNPDKCDGKTFYGITAGASFGKLRKVCDRYKPHHCIFHS